MAGGAGALGSGTTVGTTAITVNSGGTLLISGASTDHVRNNATIRLGTTSGTSATLAIAKTVSEGAAATVSGAGQRRASVTLELAL